MKDFAKSIRTGNDATADRLGLKPVVEGISKDIIEIYKKNGQDRELTKKELVEKHHMTEKQAEETLRKLVGNSKSFNKATVLKDGNVWVVLYANETKSQEFETEEEAREFAKKVGNSKVGNANKIFSGKYLDIYDNGLVVAKEGWAFGESFNENTFGRWIDEQIRAKEKTLQECKQMKREFESNY